ncbi:ribonuclease H-like domain-containing protein, partial [Tanacetum coccineum]
MESQSETTQTVSALKLPILKTREYDLWSMRMEQYLTFIDNALWEVIVNGDSVLLVASASTGAEAIPDEHLLKFHACKDAKSLWEAIKNSQEGLDKTYDRFQKLISQLEIHGEVISQEDANLKLVRSLPSAWNNIALIMRNKSNLDTLSMDNLYNNMKIDADDLEEMDLKWQVAMLTIRVKRAPINQVNRNRDAPRRNAPVDTSTTNALVVQDGIGGYDWGFQAEEELTNFALMAFTSQGSSSSDSEVHTCSKDCLKSYEALQKQYDHQRETLNKSNLEITGYQMGLESLEARIVIHEKNEVLEEALKEKDDLKLKLENFEESLKNLTKLINSQISAKDKTGLGYDSQINESELNNIHKNESEVIHSMFNSRESDVDDNLVNDRFKTGEGFHAVPPPYTGNYMPPRPDLSFAGLDESVFKFAVRKTTTSVAKTETSISKTSKDIALRNRNQIVKMKMNLTVEKPRKFSQSPRDNKRNWNGLMTQRLGGDFEFKKKACFVCGSFNYLIKDCDFHDNKMVEKPVLNKKGRITGQREIRPVWNNAQRVNHQNELTHPHPKRAAISISAARRINTAASRPNVNDALPTTYSYFKAHSPVTKPFNQKSAVKTNNFYKKINTARVNNVTTTGQKVVVRTGEENRDNVVKSSACWIWRPKGNLIDHISKDCGSYTPKRFDYVDPQGKLKSIMAWDQGIFESGCSRHMIGNKFYLSDYQEIDGGFVEFGESPKRGKIIGKGKIRTGKLDFEDVYFVKELKFNLFSVSQMCDKKNSVLFTETECLVLSPDFKLLDESQVLLKVPRQNNMYSFDLKNVVPSGGLTCLFAKATIDESNLWHKRLGHINFKTMNKLVRGNLIRGLPSKLFKNDHTCVACQKGKQHKAS